MEAKIEELKMNIPVLHDVSRKLNLPELHKNDGEGTLNTDVPATEENLRKVDAAVKAMEIYNDHHPQTRFQYRTDTDTGRIQVALVNYMTGEVVEEIPSKKLLQFSHQLEEMVGLVMEEHA